MPFEGGYKTQDYFRYFLHLFSVPSFIFSKNGRGLILAYSVALFKGWFHLWSFCSVKNASCSFTCIYVDLLKLKANNYLKKVMLTSPGFFFKEANL